MCVKREPRGPGALRQGPGCPACATLAWQLACTWHNLVRLRGRYVSTLGTESRNLEQRELSTSRESSKVAFIAVVVLASHLLLLQPMVDRMQETADALCAGRTSFSFFEDAAGFVFLRNYSATSSSQTATYAYRAVFEATGLKGSLDLQPAAVRVVSEVLQQVIVELEGRNLESRNDFMPVCLDSDHPILAISGLENFGTAAVQLMREIFQSDEFDSCPSASAYCDDWSYRAYSLWRLRGNKMSDRHPLFCHRLLPTGYRRKRHP